MGNNTRIATLLNGAISLLAVVAITLVCIVPTAFAEDGANPSDAPGAGADNSVEQIAGPVPNIIITNFTDGDGSVAVGSTFNLGFTFQNMGKVAVSNMVVTVDGGDKFCHLRRYEHVLLRCAECGGVGVDADRAHAGAGRARRTARRASTSASNTSMSTAPPAAPNTSDIKISVPVSQPDRFELGDPVLPDTVNAGEETTITMEYVNKGKGDVSNVEATVEGDGITATQATQYVGNVASGAVRLHWIRIHRGCEPGEYRGQTDGDVRGCRWPAADQGIAGEDQRRLRHRPPIDPGTDVDATGKPGHAGLGCG